jgi:hypothetical protein
MAEEANPGVAIELLIGAGYANAGDGIAVHIGEPDPKNRRAPIGTAGLVA